jgi:hypothetical protein
MAKKQLKFDTQNYAVIRHETGSLEIASKRQPARVCVFQLQARRYLERISAAHHQEGLDGVDRICGELLSSLPGTEYDSGGDRLPQEGV